MNTLSERLENGSYHGSFVNSTVDGQTDMHISADYDASSSLTTTSPQQNHIEQHKRHQTISQYERIVTLPSPCHRIKMECNSDYPFFCVDEDFPSFLEANECNQSTYLTRKHDDNAGEKENLIKGRAKYTSIHRNHGCIRVVDLQKSFAPNNILSVLFRIGWLALSCYNCRADYKLTTDGTIGPHLRNGVYYYFYRIIDYFGGGKTHHAMTCLNYWSHLTHITMAVTILYQCLSTTISLLSMLCCQRYNRAFFALRTIKVPTSNSINASKQHSIESWRQDIEPTTYQGTGQSTEERCDDKTCKLQSVPMKIQDNQLVYHRPNLLLCLTWMLYVISFNAEFTVMLGYWLLVHDSGDCKDIQYLNLYKHGIIFALLFIDGYIIGRVPIRCKHVLWVISYGLLYVIWTLVYAYFLKDTYGEGYLIYEWLDWIKFPEVSAMMCLALLGITILFFMVCLMLSMCSCSGCYGRRRLTTIEYTDAVLST